MSRRNGGIWVNGFVARWIVVSIALLILPHITNAVEIHGLGAVVFGALLLGVVNATVRPVLILLSLPIQILTLGLFTFVINALMLLLVSWIVGPSFVVRGFWGAVWASILLSLVSSVITWLIKDSD